LTRQKALVRFGIVAGITLAAHATFLPRKVLPVDSQHYAQYGIDLKVDPVWRIGFIAGVHGATLVKARNTGTPPKERADSWHQELKSVMARELKLIPAKFIAEAFFYLFLLTYLVLASPHLRRALQRRSRDRPIRIVAALTPGAIFFFLAASPLLIWGYGYGGFTNLVGPGCMSFSGPYFHLRAWLYNSSNSISYRAFVSPITLPVGTLVGLVWEGLRSLPILGAFLDSEPETALPYWFAGAFLYGLVGVALERTARLIAGCRTATSV
jgi:hypothetical protein